MPGLLQTVISNTILEVIIGANFLGTIGGAYLRLALGSMLLGLLFFMKLFELRREDLHRFLSVRLLTPLRGRTHVDTGRLVDEPHCRFDFVHVLPTCPPASPGFPLDIGGGFFFFFFFSEPGGTT